jgi:transcriptional regulator with XRE-family HTH domain
VSGQEQDSVSANVVARNVASEMARTRVTATQLAAKIGTTERQVYRVLNATHEPRLSTVERFAAAFGRTATWLLTEHPNGDDHEPEAEAA